MSRGSFPRSGPALLGYALSFVNSALNVELFGSPKEIQDELRGRKLDLAVLVAHPQTEIETEEVLRASPRLTLSGGPHAETIIELLEAIRESDHRKAATILRQDPEAVRSPHFGAGIPLLAAVSARRADMVDLFLQAGAGIDVAGELGMTPLHWAAVLGVAEMAGTLLDAGAESERKSWFYVTAGELGAINGRDAVVRLIADRDPVDATGFSVDRVLERMSHD